MYTCGPTVYRYAHVGNLRSNLLADLIRRALLYHGIDVLHVKNITDVGHLRDEGFDRGEDPMLVAAGLEHKTPAEIADAYEAAFHADEAAGQHPARPRLPARHRAHPGDARPRRGGSRTPATPTRRPTGNVYYEVGRFEGYGRLSGNSWRTCAPATVATSSRTSATRPTSRSGSPPATGRILKWPTARWGEGFPGWHLECSAMAMRYLGPRFDIHTGGIDNVFPHHEDEIAQSTPISGACPPRHWVHGEFLLMEGKKMAKSAGNFQRVTELVDRGLDPLAFRYLVLTSRYGRKLEYSDRSLDAAAAALGSLRAGLRALGEPPTDGPWAAPAALVAGAAGDRPDGRRHRSRRPWHRAGWPASRSRTVPRRRPLPCPTPVARCTSVSWRAIDDDLDMPVALALLREILRAPLPADERRWLILDADAVLGLDLHRVWEADAAADARRRRPGRDPGARRRADRRPRRARLGARRCAPGRARGGWLGRHRRSRGQPTRTTRA